MINFGEFFNEITGHTICWKEPSSPDWRLIEHSYFGASFLHFIFLQRTIYNKSIMFMPL